MCRNISIKILYKVEGEYGSECAVALNDKVVILDNMFDGTLESYNIDLNTYITWDILKKFEALFSEVIDCYYHSGKETMDKLYRDFNRRECKEFIVLDHCDIPEEMLLQIIEDKCTNYFLQFKNDILTQFNLV